MEYNEKYNQKPRKVVNKQAAIRQLSARLIKNIAAVSESVEQPSISMRHSSQQLRIFSEFSLKKMQNFWQSHSNT